jgi:hypothetical protein
LALVPQKVARLGANLQAINHRLISFPALHESESQPFGDHENVADHFGLGELMDKQHAIRLQASGTELKQSSRTS